MCRVFFSRDYNNNSSIPLRIDYGREDGVIIDINDVQLSIYARFAIETETKRFRMRVPTCNKRVQMKYAGRYL